jgi:hypothetical protein
MLVQGGLVPVQAPTTSPPTMTGKAQVERGRGAGHHRSTARAPQEHHKSTTRAPQEQHKSNTQEHYLPRGQTGHRRTPDGTSTCAWRRTSTCAWRRTSTCAWRRTAAVAVPFTSLKLLADKNCGRTTILEPWLSTNALRLAFFRVSLCVSAGNRLSKPPATAQPRRVRQVVPSIRLLARAMINNLQQPRVSAL